MLKVSKILINVKKTANFFRLGAKRSLNKTLASHLKKPKCSNNAACLHYRQLSTSGQGHEVRKEFSLCIQSPPPLLSNTTLLAVNTWGKYAVTQTRFETQKQRCCLKLVLCIHLITLNLSLDICFLFCLFVCSFVYFFSVRSFACFFSVFGFCSLFLFWYTNNTRQLRS